jgi:RNA polymerase sigma-70 factor (ECF subfamily)
MGAPFVSKVDDMDPTAELVQRCTRGDQSAFDSLVRMHMNAVLGLAFNYLGNFHTAEDIAQDTFVQAFQSIPTLRDGARFKVWLLRIARNKCIDHIRRTPRWMSIDQDQELQKEVSLKVAAVPGPEEEACISFTEADLLAALGTLREDYREIFVMKHIDNLSYREIAEILGMTASAVGEKLYRVRTMIREKLTATESGSSPL